MNVKKSPLVSLAGWDWKTWLKGNKESVKLFVALFVGLVNGSGDAAVIAVTAIVSKAVLDIVDYAVLD
jgi:hypothetical protein